MFRYMELSDPLYERDHLRLLTFKSPALRGRGDATVFSPPGIEAERSVPLVVLLHGVYCSHWAWSLKGGAHRTALNLIENQSIRPMVIAMPSDGLWGDGTGYLAHDDSDYERWIMDDVVGCVTEVMPCLDAKSPLLIAGLSMGGYGALRLGAKYAHRVNGFSGHSSITHPSQLEQFVEEPLSLYGEALHSADAEILYWIKEHKEILPPFRFDCGTSDALIEENRKLHFELLKEGITHHYAEFDGGHTWEYWSEHITDTLVFFDSICKNLPADRL